MKHLDAAAAVQRNLLLYFFISVPDPDLGLFLTKKGNSKLKIIKQFHQHQVKFISRTLKKYNFPN
jgi:hypothetical protein